MRLSESVKSLSFREPLDRVHQATSRSCWSIVTQKWGCIETKRATNKMAEKRGYIADDKDVHYESQSQGEEEAADRRTSPIYAKNEMLVKIGAVARAPHCVDEPVRSSPLASQALTEAVSRCRRRCWAETEHDHTNLERFVLESIPSGWTVIGPPTGVIVPSGFPEKNEAREQQALQSILLPNKLPQPLLEDMLNGHCETCAVVLSEHVGKALSRGFRGRDALLSGYASLANKLQQSSVAAQVQTLFGPEARGLLTARTAGDATARQFSMWQPLLGDRALNVQ
jgi:hypothetical protein